MPEADYLPQVRAWWSAWSTSEQALHFTATSWQRLLMVLELVQAFYTKPSKDLLAEIRQNEAKLGATPEDLMRLRWKLEEPKTTGSTTTGRYDHIAQQVEDL